MMIIRWIVPTRIMTSPTPEPIHTSQFMILPKRLLGDNRYRFVFELGLNTILDDIRNDLARGLQG